MVSFEQETLTHYFRSADDKSVAAPKGNIPRIKQKISESELEGSVPGGKYIKDILRATCYYAKENLTRMQEDIEEYVKYKKGKILKFVTKSSPFQVMLVTEHGGEILCEYQFKVLHGSDEMATQRNKFNHILYEFERSEGLIDLINAME